MIGNSNPKARISQRNHKILVASFIAFTALQGSMASVMPPGAGWRFFSWHPFLMTLGFVGMMGSAIVTKKLGGYTNTKVHGMLASLGVVMTLGGLYVIFANKVRMGKPHLTSYHSQAGIITMAGCITVMIVGGVFLHPDFGVSNTNGLIRSGHKYFSRMMLFLAWITCIMGLRQLTPNLFIQLLYGLPLLILVPFSLF